MSLLFLVASYLVSFAFLGYASYRDLKSGEVSNWVWVFYAPAAALLAFSSFLLGNMQGLILYVIGACLVAMVSFALFSLGVWGGADLKAMVCVGLAHASGLLTFGCTGVLLLTMGLINRFGLGKKSLPTIPIILLGLVFACVLSFFSF